MNFGVRLPGPFRVGVSSHGRVHAGVTVGPFSASTGITGGRRPADAGEEFYPISLDGAVGELVVLGWRLTGHSGRSAILTQGWRAVQIEAVPGGVTWRPVTSRRTAVTKAVVWMAVAVGLFWFCAYGLS